MSAREQKLWLKKLEEKLRESESMTSALTLLLLLGKWRLEYSEIMGCEKSVPIILGLMVVLLELELVMDLRSSSVTAPLPHALSWMVLEDVMAWVEGRWEMRRRAMVYHMGPKPS